MVRLTNRGHFLLLTVLLTPIGLGISNSFAEPTVVPEPIIVKVKPEVNLVTVLSEMAEPKTYTRITMKTQYGWGDEQFKCLGPLWGKESAWNYEAKSPTHDYGIPQRHMRNNTQEQIKKFLDNPYVQIEWGLNYISVRYGTPCKAWEFWSKNRWY